MPGSSDDSERGKIKKKMQSKMIDPYKRFVGRKIAFRGRDKQCANTPHHTNISAILNTVNVETRT